MSILVQGTLSPFGVPIVDAKIKVTSLSNDGALKDSFIPTCTNSEGFYSFELLEGYFLIEYQQRDVMNEVGLVYVNEDTPSPITLVELIRTSEFVPVPDPVVPADWEVALDIHNQDAESNEDINQANSELGYAKDVEEVSHTKDSVLSRNFDESVSKHSKAVSEQTAFSVEGNSLATSTQSLETPNIKVTHNKVIAEDTDTEVSINDTVEVKGDKVSKSITHTENAVEDRTEASDGISFEDGKAVANRLVIRNPLTGKKTLIVNDIYHVTGNGFEALKEYETLATDSYRDASNNLVNKPYSSTNTHQSLEGDNSFTDIEEGVEQYIDNQDKGHISWFRRLINLGKEAYEEFSIKDGFSLKQYVVDKFRVGDVLEVNDFNKEVKVNGKLVVENPDDFKGDTIFQVFQYSADLVNWFDDFESDRHWRRHNTSVNGVVDPTKWSVPYRITGEDGHEGDTLYIQFQYSEDAESWHDTFLDGDIWRRERTVTNGNPSSEWSIPARIKGADGANGVTQFIEYQYSIDGLTIWHSNFSTGDHYRRERIVTDGVYGAWSPAAKLVPVANEDYFDGYSNAPITVYVRSDVYPDKPTKPSTYTFKTSTLVGLDNGWSQSIPDGVDPIYAIAASASSTGETDTIDADDWSDPVILAKSGQTIYIDYQYSADNKTWHEDLLPTDYYSRQRTVTINESGDISYGSWSNGVKIRQDGTTLYIEYSYSPDGNTNWSSDYRTTDYFRRERTVTIIEGNTTYSAWSASVRIREDGEDGYTPIKGVDYFDGTDGSFVSFIYKVSESEPTPSGGSFDGTNEVLPTGWSDNPVFSASAKTWVSQRKYSPIGTTGSNWVGGAWSKSVQYLGQDGYTPIKGEDYFDGVDGSFISYVFKNSSTPPSTPTTGSFDGTTETYPTGWSDNPVFSGTQKTWVTKRTYKVVNGKWVGTSWSTPTQYLGVDGENGETRYVDYQYSADSSSWHEDFLSGDYFRRERTVTIDKNGNVSYGSWSTGVRIRQDGTDGYTPVKGEDYFDGKDGSFVSYIFFNSVSEPAVPTGGSFNGTTETYPVGWTDNPVFSSAQKTWMSKRTYKPTGTTGSSWEGTVWSEPTQYLGIDGSDGQDGLNSATVNLYKRSVTANPTMPTATVTYTFNTGATTGVTQGWGRSIPAGTDPIYVISAVALGRDATDTIGTGEWSSPVVIAQNGNDGQDGLVGSNGAGSYIWLRGNLDTVTQEALENWVKGYVGFDDYVPKGAIVQVCNSTILNQVTDSDYYIKEGVSVSDWHEFDMVVNGSSIIDGTLAAKALRAKSITGDLLSANIAIESPEIRCGAGGIHEGYHTIIKPDGTIKTSKLIMGGDASSRMTLTNEKLEVYNQGVLKVRIGKLS